MQTLKIVKIGEGIFKHVEDENIEFFSTNDLKLNIYGGLINFRSSNGLNSNFVIGEISVFDLDSTTPLVFTTLDAFLVKLITLGHPSVTAPSSGSSGTTTATTAKEFIAPVALFNHTVVDLDHIFQLDKTTHKIDLINDVAVSSDGVAYDSDVIWSIESGNLIITTSTPLTGYVRITGN